MQHSLRFALIPVFVFLCRSECFAQSVSGFGDGPASDPFPTFAVDGNAISAGTQGLLALCPPTGNSTLTIFDCTLSCSTDAKGCRVATLICQDGDRQEILAGQVLCPLTGNK